MTERGPDPDGGEDPAQENSPDAEPVSTRVHSRRRRRHRRKRIERPASVREIAKTEGLFLLVLVGSILPLGSIHVPVLLVVSGVAMLALAREAFASTKTLASVPGMAAVLIGLALYTVLQALPIPFFLLQRFSPVAADIWGHALEPLGGSAPRLASISLDPGASWVEALKWCLYAAVFVTAAGFGARRGPQWGALVIFGAAVIVATATIGHGLFNANRVFGIYTPTMGGRGWRIGPLVNANALAGYLNLGLLAGVGLVASSAPPLRRWVLAIAVAVVLGVSVNTGSRGGLGALLVGLVLLAPLIKRARSAEGSLSLRDQAYVIGAVTLALAAGAIFATMAATGMTAHLLSDPSVRKLRMFLWAPAMLQDYPWFGIGRGAFEGAFPAYRMGDNNSVYSHPENFLVQWATEWGIPVACAIIVAFAWLLRPKAWGAERSAAGAGLFAGFLSLGVQNVVDLGLEIPGVAVAACAAAGIAWGARPLDEAPSNDGPSYRPQLFAAAMAALGLGLILPAALVGANTLKNDKEKVSEAFPEDPQSPGDWAVFKGLLQQAMSRHPAEPYFPRTGALFAMLRRTDNPVPWIQRALDRAGSSGRTHYLLAVLLARHRIETQALLELRYAIAEDQDLSGHAARLALRLTRNHDELMRVVPDGPEGAKMLSVLAASVKRSDRDLAFRFFEESIERNPGAVGAHLELSRMLLLALEDRRLESRCSAERRAICQRAVLEHARAIAKAQSDSDEPLVLVGKLLMVTGYPDRALQLVSSTCPKLTQRSRCRRTWIEAAVQSKDSEELTRAIRYSERDGCATPRACSDTYGFIGSIVAHESGPHAALPFFQRAAQENPSKANYMRVAATAAFIGEHGVASAALNRAAAFGTTPQLQESLERERTAAMRATLKLQ
jgi:hypothetical protein